MGFPVTKISFLWGMIYLINDIVQNQQGTPLHPSIQR